MSIQDLQDFAEQLNNLVESRKFLLFLLMNMSSEEIEEYKKRYQAERLTELEYKEAERRWIPCSERLPIGQGEVIVSCHDDSGDTSYDYTTCGWITREGEYWIADNEINSHVVAWMPLPKPYEERKEE